MKRAIFTFILILVSGARNGAEQLPIRTYTTADGLARDGINKIVSDPRGYLWFCTYDGLSRFDGYEFVNYGVAQGLPHRRVSDLLITRSGEYWVATSGGLAHFNPLAATPEAKFKTYVPKTDSDAQAITDLYEDSAGTIWAGTGNGLHVLRHTGNDWQLESVSLGEKPDELDITSVVEAAPGVLWIGSEQGLFRRFDDGRVERFGVKDGLPHPHVRDILRDRDGTVWIATGLGLCRLVANVQPGHSIVDRVYNKKDGLLSESIFGLFRSSSGWLWLATTIGLSEFSPDPLPDGGHFINYTRAHGMSDNGVTSLAEDQDGNLWVGSESGGVMKITRRGFTSYSEADGLAYSRIAALGEDRAGELFVVTTSADSTELHIHSFNGRRFEDIRVSLPAKIVPTWGWNQLLLQDRTQQWWVPANGGLIQFPPLHSLKELATARPIKVFNSDNGLSGDQPFRLYEDSRGDIWMSIISTPSNSYLNRWERATGQIYMYSENMAQREDSAPTAFQEDRNGDVWIGFYWGGLARYHEGRFDPFGKTDGVPAGMIRALYLDHLGRLWIASTEGGLARIDDPSQDHPAFVHYTVKEGLSSDQITCITEDQFGRIYLGTGLGVDRLEPESGRIKRFTLADGLPNGFVNVAFRDRSNTLWFGTLQGLSKLSPTFDGPAACASDFDSAGARWWERPANLRAGCDRPRRFRV